MALASPFSSLPDHLLQHILAFLPPFDLSRLRSVCKSWLSATSSPQFLHLYTRLHHPSPTSTWLLLYTHRQQVLTWASPQCRWLSTLNFPSFWILDWAAAGGLLCLRCLLSGVGNKGYFVGNPLTGAWKQLPDPPQTKVGKVWSLSTCGTSESYSIVVSDGASRYSVQIYDSEVGDWSLKTLPQSVAGSCASENPVLTGSATGIGDLVYTINGASRSVFTYDVKRNLWKSLGVRIPEALTIQISWQPGYVIEMIPKIVEGPRGKISLIGGLSGECQGLESIGAVWELDRSSMVWREVARAPLEMGKSMLEEAKESREPPLLPVKYAGEGDLIFIMALGCCRALKYSLSCGNWEWLELPSTSDCVLSLSLQPSIAAGI